MLPNGIAVAVRAAFEHKRVARVKGAVISAHNHTVLVPHDILSAFAVFVAKVDAAVRNE